MEEIDPLTLASLTASYVRRKRWEQRTLAAEVISALAEALNAKPRPAEVPATTLLRMMSEGL